MECPVGIGQGNGIGLANVFQLNGLTVKAGFRLVALDIRQDCIIGFFDLGIPSKGCVEERYCLARIGANAELVFPDNDLRCFILLIS